MFPVMIIDDDLFESVEELNLELRFDGMIASSGVILSPDVSNVRILDDDGNRPITLLTYSSYIMLILHCLLAAKYLQLYELNCCHNNYNYPR